MRAMQHTGSLRRRPALRPALLLALALLAAQWLLAIHQVGHLSADHDQGFCEICALGGGLDHGVTVSIAVPEPASGPVFHAATRYSITLPLRALAFRVRAPPRFPSPT